MGEDCRPWFTLQQLDWQSPTLNSIGAPLHLGQQSTLPPFVNPGIDMVSMNGTLPVYPFPEQPQTLASQTGEPCGWFYGLPRFRRAFIPPSNSVLKEKIPRAPHDSCREANIPKPESGSAQKKFLVFDQSGDRTTLIFRPGIGAPVRCFTSWSPKLTGAHNLNREDHGPKENLNLNVGANSAEMLGENGGADLQSEMHEDTEELNALLYSDESDYTDDDEVTSTGHSPSTMTAHDKDWFEGITEEVASSDGLNKKRKLFDGIYSDNPSLVDTASSLKAIRGEYEDVAESRCDRGIDSALGEMSSQLGNKRIRKERIRETVSVLQNMIPGVKGKDAIMVIDEAIRYLKSLKLKVKALGLDALCE